MIPIQLRREVIIFDETSSVFSKSMDFNIAFVKSSLKYCQERLNLNGYLFMNDIRDALEIPRTPDGQLHGYLRLHDTIRSGIHIRIGEGAETISLVFYDVEENIHKKI